MKLLKHLFLIFLALPAFSQDLTRFVNPFIGTGGHGHTFPGPCLPNGLVQLSPTTDTKGWDWASGYHYNDTTLMGFSHTHISGTGVGDLGDLLLQPSVGKVKTDWGSKKQPFPSFRQTFSHKNEKAEVGYYSVLLNESGVLAELTTTERCGLHRYTFPQTDSAQIFIEPNLGIGDRDKTAWIKLKFEDDSTLSGYRMSFGWVPFQYVFFVIRFSKKMDYFQCSENNRPKWMKKEVEGGFGHASAFFKTSKGERILTKVGISMVSVENARDNLNHEMPDWDFEKVVRSAKEKWNRILSTLEIEGTQTQKEIFYTGLYHAFIQPNNITDRNGQYRGVDYQIASAEKNYYSTFSLWDTYRAAHPLYTLVKPDFAADMVKTMIVHFEKQGFLPIWTLWGAENYCMIANHAIPVVVDAYFKGLIDKDWQERAYKAVYETSVKSHRESDWELYERHGYYPFDKETSQSVSKTLEVCFNDWCVAQMAKAMGKEADFRRFEKRQGFYRNLFNPSSGFFQARNSEGKWLPDFNPLNIRHSHGYTEANAWQYLWYVPQNVPDLISLLGGPQKFEGKLDSLFSMSSKVDGNLHDVTGFIGQYVHGNEPSHHIAYLYNYIGKPEKTKKMVKMIADSMYHNRPDGYAGNEDCGQMSSWYIFSALGFYPVNPASGLYDLGFPLVKKAVLRLPDGKQFIVRNNRKEGKKGPALVSLNGKKLPGLTISHEEIMQGGELTFE